MVMKPGFPSERVPRLPRCSRETRSHPSPTFLCASCTSPKPIARSFSSRLVSWSVVSFTRDRLDDVATCGGGSHRIQGLFSGEREAIQKLKSKRVLKTFSNGKMGRASVAYHVPRTAIPDITHITHQEAN